MKAKELLHNILRCGVPADAMGWCVINSVNTPKELFGVDANRPIPHGDYLYIRTDKISDTVFGYLEGGTYDIIMTDEQDMVHEEEGVPIMYMLFDIED